MNEDGAIRSIVVTGGGIVGLSAAIAFARALPDTSVSVIETPVDPAALADRLPTALPEISRFHALIGLDEQELVRSGIATHHLGTLFRHWSASGEEWVHAFGAYGKPVGTIRFDQVWLRARAAVKALPFDRYSMGAALARAGKFVHPAQDPNFVGSRFLYGLRFDPDRYRERLRAHCEHSRVEFRDGQIADVERREDGGIAALHLEDGARTEADLFVDCAGPSAQLLSGIDDSFEDWGSWLPFGRLTLTSEASGDIPATADRVAAGTESWTIEWPLRGRTMTARIGREGDVRITRGRRLRPWVHNVLALGDAATALDPLQGLNLDAAHSAILLALELLPGRDFHAVEIDEYNRRAEQVTRRMRDFSALPYLRSGRTDGEWAQFVEREPPDSLALTLDQYGFRGRLPFYEEESVTRDSWAAAMLGLGIIPRNLDPQSREVPLEEAVPAMSRLAAEIEQIVAGLPSYADYLARMSR
jgi:tryptophan halogenase